MSIYEELAGYERYFRGAKNELDILRTDLELAQEGWTLHFAIDFAELFAFAFPLTQTPHLAPQPEEPGSETFTREQATLAFLFSKWGEQVLSGVRSLILLPPYKEELSAALRAFQLRRFEAYSYTGILRTLQSRAYGHAYGQIRNLVVRYIQEKKVPESPRDRAAIASYIEEEYPDVVSLVATTDTQAGLSVLKAILDSGIISSVNNHFIEEYPLQAGKVLDLRDILDDNTIKQNSQKWLTKLNEVRPERTVANSIDASACAMIRAINKELLEHQSVLLIFSHSRAIKAIAEDNTPEDTTLAKEAYGDSKSGSGVRSLDYLWYYYVHKEDNRKDTLQRVSTTIDLLERFAELQTKLGLSWETRQSLVREAETVLEKCGNLSLGATTVAPLLEWLEETRRGLASWYGESSRLSDAILRMIRDTNMADELTARRDEEHSRFESVIQDYVTKL